MVKSLFSRFSKKTRKDTELVSTLDVSRAFGGNSLKRPIPNQTEAKRPKVDVESWKRYDLERLSTAWERAQQAPSAEDAKRNLESIIHDLHGASGAYGGGALTRLTGSLQRLVQASDDIEANAALINLHVQACRAAGLGKAADSIADAVCDALEAQVEASLDV